jgi:hypothetical protein
MEENLEGKFGASTELEQMMDFLIQQLGDGVNPIKHYLPQSTQEVGGTIMVLGTLSNGKNIRIQITEK